MAVQSSFYVPDGNTRTFPSTKHIATKQHVGVYLQRALDSVWETALSTSYELVNNSIVFDSAVDNILYVQIEIRVVDTTAELIDSPSSISLVAASIADVNTVVDSILDVNTVADNIGSVQNVSSINANISTVAGISTNVTTVAGVSTSIPTVAGISANVTTVAGVSGNVTTVANNISNVNTNATNIADINSVATTVVPNIAEILLADDNATTATTQAGIATTQATNSSSSATQSQLYEWEAEAERLTSDSYATEAEDTFVNLVTSDGDGTFTYTPTTDYSALHWAAKAATFNPAIYAPLASPALTGTPTVGGDAIKYLTAQPSWTGVSIGGGETLYPDGTICGSNANGSYTKYPNGDLICRLRRDTVSGTPILVEGYYVGTAFDWTFPHNFVATTYVLSGFAKWKSGASPISIASTSGSTNTTSLFYGIRAVYGAGTASTVSDMYIEVNGRWK